MAQKNFTKNSILENLKKNKIDFLQLQFIDIFGICKNVEVPSSQFEKALNGEILFDGSSIDGFVRIEESDMLLVPDLATFRIYDWGDKSEDKVARLICNVHNADGSEFDGCPRLTLIRAAKEAAKMGFNMVVGPEAEFFIFKKDPISNNVTLTTNDRGGYFDMAPVDEGEIVRREIIKVLQRLDFEVEAGHHEVAPGQHEIDFKYEDAVTAADNIITFKLVVKKIATRHGMHATFMPKPVFGLSGNGMHCHQSLFKDDKNVFFDAKGEWQLSKLCLQYLAGILEHSKGMVAITNPLINSYKRLVPGYEAPINIAWSEKNRSPLIRIPAKRGKSTRIEVRVPDPACNPYLALAVMLAAGLDGIKKKMVPPAPVNKNIFEMTQREKARLKISNIPANLSEALHYLKRDEVLKAALGEHIYNHFYEAKRKEWEAYTSFVHNWEVDQYLINF
ncbi:MAG: type I glutamate--ammonia ligase [Oligoflexia bacterium]|nr:type I glutamate--ammonia ligase [Oligoflexia bacterium]MBF0366582.1 type I glutamate--ammonia ligase [Oligoflexia bacterium]